MNSLALLLVLLFTFAPRPLQAWGPLGHMTIAAIAEKHLSTSTQAHVTAVLAQGHDSDLPSIANWADEVRAAASGRGPLKDDAEARAFNAKFPTNALWHFVDLPLGAADYREVGPFTSPNDIVHAIKRCVAVLEAFENRAEDFTKPQALRLLVHFVGDIHQPLHCGTGFYDLADLNHPILITEPRLCTGKPSDRGGNDLFFGSEGDQELHALWDGALVCSIRNSPDYLQLAEWLQSTLGNAISSPIGEYYDWPEQWAIDSVRQARKVYGRLEFGPATTDNQRLRIAITLPPDYTGYAGAIAAQQLVKAGFHLAQLLNSIQWK